MANRPLARLFSPGNLNNDMTMLAESFVDDRPFAVARISAQHVGRGGNATIYCGKTDPDDRARLGHVEVVALKVLINSKQAARGQSIARELRAAKLVQHAYILPYLGFATIGESYMILVSPYMKNGNLLEYLKDHPGLEKRQLLLQIATAVNFLHTEHNMIHGDLKCENVIVTDDGRAQLADFGLSTTIAPSEVTVSDLRQQITAAFAAPELLYGAEGETRSARRTTQTDVYAYGMTLIQAFIGRTPWDWMNYTQLVLGVEQHIAHPRPNGVSDPLWRVYFDCCRYEPSERPAMGDVVRMLLQARSDEMVDPVASRDETPTWRGSFRWISQAAAQARSEQAEDTVESGQETVAPPSRQVRQSLCPSRNMRVSAYE